MKLRLDNENLRLRISPEEHETFLKKGLLSLSVRFSPNPALPLQCRLHRSLDQHAIRADFFQGEIDVYLPDALAECWAAEPGLSLEGFQQNDEAKLRIRIEVDGACRHDR